MTLMFPKTKTWRSKAHLDHVRTLSCAGCGRPGPSTPHHVVNGGKGLKCSDALTSPLCDPCHGLWHSSENRVGPCSTREESLLRIWCGCVAALGGTRLADNCDPESIARRLAAERERR